MANNYAQTKTDLAHEKSSAIRLPCFGIEVRLAGPNGSISSSLRERSGGKSAAEYNAAVDGIEALILAHARAGLDIETPAYLEGIETAVLALADKLST